MRIFSWLTFYLMEAEVWIQSVLHYVIIHKASGVYILKNTTVVWGGEGVAAAKKIKCSAEVIRWKGINEKWKIALENG